MVSISQPFMSFREEGPVELMLISRPDFPKIGWKFIYIIHTFKFVQVDRILDLAKPRSNIMLSSQNFSLVTKYKTLIYTKKHYILWQLYWCMFYDSGIWAHISGIWLIFYCNNIPPIIANSSL